MTSPSLRPEDSCDPYRMMNGRLCVQVEHLSADCSSKCGFTTRTLRWVSLTVCSLVLRPGTYGAWERSFLIWRVMIADIMLLNYYGIPEESCSTSTALYWQKFHRICPIHGGKHNEISIVSCHPPLLLKMSTFPYAASIF